MIRPPPRSPLFPYTTLFRSVAHYRPPVPTTGTHFAILFHTSASEEKISFGGEVLSSTEFCESEMTEGVLNWSYRHPSKIHVGINESPRHDGGSPSCVPQFRFLKRRALIMLEPVPHDVPVNLRPCGVRSEERRV